jgi:hypothetical protein
MARFSAHRLNLSIRKTLLAVEKLTLQWIVSSITMRRINQNMEPVVVIPANYEELSHSERKRIVPICIRAFDEHGRQIAGDWFSRGVAPIRRKLVAMADHALGDPWCASELAETTVHRLWARHGHAVGRYPERRVLTKARWVAEELRTGDWRKMRFPNLYLALDALEEKLREQAVADPNEYADEFARQILLDSVEERLKREGPVEICIVYQLLRRGYRWREVAEKLGVPYNEPLRRRFYRWIKHLARE